MPSWPGRSSAKIAGAEPVLTPESGRMNVPLEGADGAADVLIGFRQSGVAITSVSVAQPTLDEVFFAITGHGADTGRRTGPSRNRYFRTRLRPRDRSGGPVSTMTASPAPASRAPLRIVDPAAAVARTRPRITITETISQTLIMAWRALKKMRRNPEQFFDVTLQPLLFTAMFAYLFGGAISGNVQSYLPLLIPGIVAQTVLTTCMATGVQLREDMDKGVFDRFKALPMARIAPLAGPMIADLVRYLIAASLTFVMGVIIGYRPGGGVLGVLGAIVLAIFTGWALAWIFTFIGTIAKSARAVQGMSMMILFPLTFLSNAFVPVTTLPGWLAAFVKVNPVSHLVSATRDLANQGVITSEVGWTLLAGLVVIAIFAPLSVRSYRRHL